MSGSEAKALWKTSVSAAKARWKPFAARQPGNLTKPAKRPLHNLSSTRQGFDSLGGQTLIFCPRASRASLVHRTPARSTRDCSASLVKTILRFFFRLLYHQFAFTYDLVAATVSFNRWKDWVMSVIPFIKGNRILEIGHGPGHLQRILLSRNLVTVGIDESAQMGHLAKRNLTRFPRSHTNDVSRLNDQHIV